ncbi:hypothetical protein CAPTEDRAFT_213403 [Capitella teleta]|uniref:DUF4371 domain-containing protein n=1 Tax=Capitella teleta TaxID=283909 RepID=R7UPR6_CAPTE|nr:hypothetical protein CAPTEDRAFT_213403 [Capitella teleta]|eukprot:ELU08068.1 hypothetical protein CAPTEDRAFT_213403 [Capitella teleta]
MDGKKKKQQKGRNEQNQQELKRNAEHHSQNILSLMKRMRQKPGVKELEDAAALIQSRILNEIKEAKYFSIMVDEVTLHNKELMPLCIRFMDAIYTHCSGHCLNLVIGTFCSLPEIRNTLERMKAAVNFFLYSHKCENVLNKVMALNSHPLKKRMALIDVCRTRWAACHRAYSHFYVAYTWIVKSFEVIAFGAYKDVYNNNVTSGWEAKYKAEANRLLNAITNFEFIVVFTVYKFLSVFYIVD